MCSSHGEYDEVTYSSSPPGCDGLAWAEVGPGTPSNVWYRVVDSGW